MLIGVIHCDNLRSTKSDPNTRRGAARRQLRSLVAEDLSPRDLERAEQTLEASREGEHPLQEVWTEMPVKRFSHLAIRVSDVEASRRFYRDAFGFEERTQLTIKGGPTALLLGDPELQLDAIFLERDGVVIELQKIHYPDGDTRAGFVRMGLCHFGLYVSDLDAVLATVIECGGDVVESSRLRNADYESDLVFVSDPDGTFIELIDVPGDPGGPPGEPIG